jgi:hypothetical protein
VSKWKPCAVENNKIIPCKGLDELYEYVGKGKGVQLMHLTNIETGEHSRSMVLLKSGKHKDRGLVANFCPVCGANISDHIKAMSTEAA